ncbi:MAG: hypothetical protein ACI8RD_000730 [Bacillariaceae sp.]|jgi:hypothetical protein
MLIFSKAGTPYPLFYKAGKQSGYGYLLFFKAGMQSGYSYPLFGKAGMKIILLHVFTAWSIPAFLQSG